MAFGTILKTPAKTDSQKRITELAHMAMARIYYDRGQFTNALDEYSKIGLKSELINEALYEMAWVSIKGKEYDKAARSLDLLMLNAPDSPLIPEVKLLIGQLHIRENAYQPATDTFAKTRDEYAPVHRQLYDALMKTGNAPLYFRDLIGKNLSKFDWRRSCRRWRTSGCRAKRACSASRRSSATRASSRSRSTSRRRSSAASTRR